MIIRKEITDDNELCLYFDGKLIFKRWLDQGYAKVFDDFAWGKYKERSITDFSLQETPRLYHVECKLRLFTKEEGGRVTPIANGYRPDHVFEYEENGSFINAFMGDFQFGLNNFIEPGTNQIVTARFPTHQLIEQYLTIGQKWWIHEGLIKIGEAEMIKIALPEIER